MGAAGRRELLMTGDRQWINTFDVVSNTDLLSYTGEEGNTYAQAAIGGTVVVSCIAATGRAAIPGALGTQFLVAKTNPGILADRVFKIAASYNISGADHGAFLLFPLYIDQANRVLIQVDPALDSINMWQILGGVSGTKSTIYDGTLVANYPSGSEIPIEASLVGSTVTLTVGAESVDLTGIDSSLTDVSTMAVQLSSFGPVTAYFDQLTIDY